MYENVMNSAMWQTHQQTYYTKYAKPYIEDHLFKTNEILKTEKTNLAVCCIELASAARTFF